MCGDMCIYILMRGECPTIQRGDDCLGVRHFSVVIDYRTDAIGLSLHARLGGWERKSRPHYAAPCVCRVSLDAEAAVLVAVDMEDQRLNYTKPGHYARPQRPSLTSGGDLTCRARLPGFGSAPHRAEVPFHQLRGALVP